MQTRTIQDSLSTETEIWRMVEISYRRLMEERNKRFVLLVGLFVLSAGKTYLPIAVGIKALQRDFRVLFTTTAHILRYLHVQKSENNYHKKLNFNLVLDILIIEELGFKKVLQFSLDDFLKSFLDVMNIALLSLPQQKSLLKNRLKCSKISSSLVL